MSDVLNHYYCAREALELLEDEPEILSIINHYYDAYRLGSQGPDFFYYNLLKGELKLSIEIGKRVHTEKVSDFFLEGLKFAQKCPEYRDETLAYLFGFLTHYALDVQTHPFIFYRTGNIDNDNPKEVSRSKKLHKYYEILLDTAMMQYEYNKLAVALNPEKVFYVKPSTLKFLEAFYSYVLEKVYGIKISKKAIAHALKFSSSLVSFFKDQSGLKRKTAGLIDKISGTDKLVTRFFYPNYTNEYEILNVEHNEWLNPVTGEARQDSYPDLYFAGVSDAKDLIKKLYNYAKSAEYSLEELENLLGGKSYLTGQNLSQPQELKQVDEDFKNKLEKY